MLNILYVENCAEIRGGSWISLVAVIDSLPKHILKPYVVFTSSRLNAETLDIDLPVFIVKKRDIYFNSNSVKNTSNNALRKFFVKLYARICMFIDFACLVIPHSLRLTLLIWRNNISIVHLNNNIYGQLSAVIAAKITGRPCICHIRSSRLPILKIEKIFARFIDKIIVISDRGEKEYIKAGIEPGKIITIYDPFILDDCRLSDKEREELKKEVGINNGDFCVGIISRIARGKGHDVFIKSAFDILKMPCNKQFKFLIIGEATFYEKSYEDEIKDMVRGSIYKDRICFLGYRKDIAKITLLLDVVVDASLLPEGLRRTVVEAMFLGKPVIATDVGADADYINDGKTGFLIRPNDHAQLADRLAFLSNNKELLKQLSLAGQEFITGKYNYSESVRRTINLYENLAKNDSERITSPLRDKGSGISVIIPTYNCAQYIGESVDSALNQTLKASEVIVVDDGSTDNTKEILSRYDGKIRYIYQNNRGPSAARNRGIKEAAGRYIAFLDADDTWLPKKLELQARFLDDHPDYGLVTCDALQFSGKHTVIVPSMAKERKLHSGRVILHLLRENFLNTNNVLIRKEVFTIVGMFDEKRRYSEDYDLWLRIAKRYKIGFVNNILTEYRSHSLNRSRVNKEEILNAHMDLVFRNLDDSGLSYLHKRAILSHVYYKIGYNHFYDNNFQDAKRFLFLSLANNPLKFISYGYLLSTFLPAGVIGQIRTIKHGVGL